MNYEYCVTFYKSAAQIEGTAYRGRSGSLSQRKRTCNPGGILSLGLEVTDDTGKTTKRRGPEVFGILWRCEQVLGLSFPA
jgi:hypothetical protein